MEIWRKYFLQISSVAHLASSHIRYYTPLMHRRLLTLTRDTRTSLTLNDPLWIFGWVANHLAVLAPQQ